MIFFLLFLPEKLAALRLTGSGSDNDSLSRSRVTTSVGEEEEGEPPYVYWFFD